MSCEGLYKSAVLNLLPGLLKARYA